MKRIYIVSSYNVSSCFLTRKNYKGDGSHKFSSELQNNYNKSNEVKSKCVSEYTVINLIDYNCSGERKKMKEEAVEQFYGCNDRRANGSFSF